MVTKDFLKDVLQGRKKLYRMSEVRFCNPPLYDEIGVKALYDKVVKLEGMSKYFPDSYPVGRKCDRSYMYNVWNTTHPEDVKEVISYANEVRYSLTSERVKQDTILITEDWQRELESLPFVSK